MLVLLAALLGALWSPAGAAVDAGIAAAGTAAVDTGPADAPEETGKDGPGAAAADWSAAAALRERIEGEIAALEALAAAQAALIEWNESRVEMGLGPAALDPGVCLGAALEAWCALLPATFGALPVAGSGGWVDGGR